MSDDSTLSNTTKLLAGLIVGSLLVLPLMVQGQQEYSASSAHKTSQYHQSKLTDHAKVYYKATWGVDNLKVNQTASGNLIRFSYRVINPELAKTLGDNKATPHLYGERSRAVLDIPVMDKIGQLRQTGAGETGKEYWMVFSNKGQLIKIGDRVNVIIGSFHADGLIVE